MVNEEQIENILKLSQDIKAWQARKKEEHFTRLMEGVETWNAWAKEKRSEDKSFQPYLLEASLSGADLSGADLSRADLSGADLSEADLSGVDLSRANLSGADLSRANLSGADLSRANLSGADLSRAYLSGADLSWAYLYGADLSRADLSGASLSGANLSEADLPGAILYRADLSDADLTDVDGLEVDSSRVVHARFSPNSSDKWSILRRTYTGPNLVLNLVLLLLFFAPLIIEGASLSAVGGAEQHVIDAVNHFDDHHFRTDCKGPDGAITGTVKYLDMPALVKDREVIWKEKNVRIPCRTQPVWKMLLGYGGSHENVMPYLTVALIAYQIVRYIMTMRISAMREAEERSGISPPRSGFLSYRRLFLVHRLMLILVGLSALAFTYRIGEILTSDLVLTGSGH